MPRVFNQFGDVIADDTTAPADDSGPSWQDVRTGSAMPADSSGQIEIDEQTGQPAVTLTVTPKGSNMLGLAFLAAALYFLMSGSDRR